MSELAAEAHRSQRLNIALRDQLVQALVDPLAEPRPRSRWEARRWVEEIERRAQADNAPWVERRGLRHRFNRAITDRIMWTRFEVMPNGCWEWQGQRNHRNQGMVGRSHKTILLTRYVWGLVNGPIPDGLYVCHSCDNPPCANPAHLWLGTHAENMADMVAKGRSENRRKLGEANPQAKLTADDVRVIRAVFPEVPAKTLADRYHVAVSQIYAVVSRRSWTNVE